MDDSRRCTRIKRDGARCRKSAIIGGTVCTHHGGGAPQVREAGRARARHARAERAVATYGLPVEVDPHDALLAEVHRTAGHVAWLGDIVQQLERDQLVWGVTDQTEKQATEYPGIDTTRTASPNVWLELYHRERVHLVKVAKAAVDAGIDERRVQLAEAQGQAIVAVLRATLEDLGVEVTPEVAQTVGRHLRSVS